MAVPLVASLLARKASQVAIKKATQKALQERVKDQIKSLQIVITADTTELTEFVQQAIAFTSPAVQQAFWDRLARTEIQRIQRRFDQSVDSEGKRFKPLTAKRIREKTANRTKPLVETGFLRKSFSSVSSERGLNITSAAPYADIHNEGIGVPKRQFVKFRDLELQAIIDEWSKTVLSLDPKPPIDPRQL